jgi:cell division protein FtsQ
MPRRRRKTAAARLRPFWFLVLLGVAVAAAFGYFLVTWPALRPHTIVVEGNRIVSKDDVLKAAAIDLRSNVWLQNTHAMTGRIDAIPYVETASVHREVPANVRISITERRPFALLKTVGGTYVLDRDLRVLQADDGSFSLLPVFVEEDVPQPRVGSTLKEPALLALRDDEEALLDAQLGATSLTHDKYGDLVVVLRDGVRVLFGDESELQKTIPLVEPILTQVGRAGRPISTIDLRAPSTPVVVYKK